MLIVLLLPVTLVFDAPAVLAAGARRQDWGERDFSDPFDSEPGVKEEETGLISDPLEPVNRVTFAFNDKFYIYLMEPAVRGYESVTPRPLRRSIGNFFGNLKEPVNFVNALLQGEGSSAHDAFGRFLLNSTFGLGGLFDVAGEHLEPPAHDFNQTLACWGVGDGFYIVWPILGSSSLRGTGSSGVDGFLNPLNYQEFEVAAGARVLDSLNTAGPYLREYKNLQRFALDPYIALKDVFEKTSGCQK